MECLSGRDEFSGFWLCGPEQLPTPKSWGLLRILLTFGDRALCSWQPSLCLQGQVWLLTWPGEWIPLLSAALIMDPKYLNMPVLQPWSPGPVFYHPNFLPWCPHIPTTLQIPWKIVRSNQTTGGGAADQTAVSDCSHVCQDLPHMGEEVCGYRKVRL